MAVKKEEKFEPENNVLVRGFKRIMPVTPDYRGDRFFVVDNGVRHATPLFVVLLVVEFTDLIFAVDSIPAIFAITTNEFIVYTSNVFAILGLRSLYFVLAGMMEKFHLLKIGLGMCWCSWGLKCASVTRLQNPKHCLTGGGRGHPGGGGGGLAHVPEASTFGTTSQGIAGKKFIEFQGIRHLNPPSTRPD